jgi:iduronate 2-sulfatase
MSIYPTLCSLAGIPVPRHVEGENIRELLADPVFAWDKPAITTFGRNNHAIRTERWRYIRYHDGGEELYDHTQDAYEWTNLAVRTTEFGSVMKELARALPTVNKPPVQRTAADRVDDDE